MDFQSIFHEYLEFFRLYRSVQIITAHLRQNLYIFKNIIKDKDYHPSNHYLWYHPFHLKINVYHISFILWIKALPVYQNFLSNELSNLFMWFFIISWVELFTIERKLSSILQFNLNIRIFEVEHYHREYWESGLWHKGCAPLPTV